MTCTGTTCNQGRKPCRDGCHKSARTCAELGVCQNRTPPCSADCQPALRQRATNQVNSPWDWIDDLSYPVDRALLIAVAAVIVAIPYLIFR
jgi:hypothetical protein